MADNDLHALAQASHRLAYEAARCRRLAESIGDTRTAEALQRLARDYERRALPQSGH